MNRPESSIDRVAKARAWFESTADTRLTWHDVEVVVRLRVTSVTTAQQLLLSNDAVIGHWDELMSALGAALESATTAGASSGTAVRDSSHAAGSPAVDQPAGVVGARYAALRAWREEQGGPASGIGDDELLLLAQAPPRNAREYKKRTELVRDHSTELTAVLEGVVGSPSTARAPSSNTTSTRVTPARPTPVPPPRATPTPSAPAPKTTTAPQMPTTMPEPAVPGPELVARPRANRPTGTTGLVDFAHYTYPEAGTSAPTPGAVAFDATGGESVDLSWPAVPDDGRVHIFSVVTKSEYLPAASPTLGDVVASTFDTSAIDTTPFRGPVRYVAIWRSSGPNEHAARAAQPALWAVGETVLPVRNCTVREDEGTVIGNWEPIPGAEHFDVYRVPLGSGLGARREVDVNHQLPGTVVTSGGFTDRDAVPGTAYEYRVYAVAMLGGANRSSPAVTRTVTLEAVAEQVLDLQVTPSEGSETSFDLTWTQPTLGQVEIYRTAEPPMSGIDDRDLDRSAIEGREG